MKSAREVIASVFDAEHNEPLDYPLADEVLRMLGEHGFAILPREPTEGMIEVIQARKRGEMDWRPISSAPKDAYVMLYGPQIPNTGGVSFSGPLVFSGYWDPLDEAWCAHGSDWAGPWFRPTHWAELPSKPKDS